MSQKRAGAPLFLSRCLCAGLSICLLLSFPFLARAQNYQCRTYRSGSIIRLDTLPIEPNSIRIAGGVKYRAGKDHRDIVLDSLPPGRDSVSICFRTVSHQVHKPIFRHDFKEYQRGLSSEAKKNARPVSPTKNPLSFGQVKSFGAITRGISFGNNQSVFVNSSLNLQMEGDLTENLKVSALITDQNIPYHPEGNTQQIRDFDNVLVKIYNEDFELKVGDIVLENRIGEGHFLKYHKNVQGVLSSYKFQLNQKWNSIAQAAGSLSKGQFASSVIVPIEGAQGPYKLRGANGERFIVILPNSEKVFLDGKPLRRGFDRDYVIDYNMGEITFSNSVVITGFSRIRVDYEFTNQYYSRSNMAFSQQFKSEGSSIYVSYYREKDNENNTLGFELSEEDHQQLQDLGDVFGGAEISGIDSVGHREGGIYYQRADTLIGSNRITIYKHSNNPEEALYRLTFSYIGDLGGDYVLANTTSNGKVYEWAGTGAGDHSPIRAVPAPNRRQMLTTGWRAKLGEHESMFHELAFSEQDRNLFSGRDDGNNLGWAWKSEFASRGRSIGFMPSYQFKGRLGFEHTHQNFGFIDRFRPVDFDRDWGYDSFSDTLPSRRDYILSASAALEKDAQNAFKLFAKARDRAEVVNGHQANLKVKKAFGRIKWDSEHYLMNSRLRLIYSSWWRSRQRVYWDGNVLGAGYQFSQERQLAGLKAKDSLTGSQMYFDAHSVYVESGDSLRARFRAEYINRTDLLPVNGRLSKHVHSQEIRCGARINQSKKHLLEILLNYRLAKNHINRERDSDNLLGNLKWQGKLAGGHINARLDVTTANVREPRREFVYVLVPAGEGTHTWRDENGDGAQDLNEFYEAANPDEKNYIRLFVPTDEYVSAFQTTRLYQVDASMPRAWGKRGSWLKLLSKMSLGAYLNNSHKIADGRFFPLSVDFKHGGTFSARNLQRVSFFYNKNAPGPGLDCSYTGRQRKSLIGQGFELRGTEEWLISGKLDLGKTFVFRCSNGWGGTLNESDFLKSRNFHLARRRSSVALVWQPKDKFRIKTTFGNRAKKSRGNETKQDAGINELSLDLTYLEAKKGNLNAGFSWLDIAYGGEANSYLGYEMLEGLQPGNNQRWNVNWQQQVRKGLQLTLQYTGRNAGGSRAVHTGNMQVTAFF